MDNSDLLQKMNIISAFIDEIKTLKNTKQCLNLAISNFSIFEASKSCVNVIKNGRGLEWESEIPKNSKFDLILGDLPFGLRKIDFQFGETKLKTRENWTIILDSLKYLMPDGIAIFLVEPTAFGTSEGVRLETALNLEGYFVSAIFNTPEGLLKPETSVTPVFVVISTNATKSIFIAELLNEKQTRILANNYSSSTVVDSDLKSGMLIPEKSFHNFNRIKIKQQIERLETQYKEYEEYTVGELAVEIIYVKSGESLKEIPNSMALLRSCE